MRLLLAFLGAGALLLPAALPASAQSAGQTQISFGPSAPNGTVTYRFSATMKGPSGSPPGGQGGPPPAPPAQTVSFTLIDQTHVKLATAGDGSPQTLVAERSADGLLHAKLRRGDWWGMPIQLYNRIALATSEASQMKLGSSQTGPIPVPGRGDQTLQGTLAVSGRPGAIQVAVDASGALTPPQRDGGPGGPGGMEPPPGGGPGGSGGPPQGGPGDDGPGPGGPGRHGPGGPPKGTVTVHITAQYVNGLFTRADSTEMMSFERPDGTTTVNRSWAVERTGS